MLKRIQPFLVILAMILVFFEDRPFTTILELMLFIYFTVVIIFVIKNKMQYSRFLLAIDILGTISLLPFFNFLYIFRFVRLLKVFRRFRSLKIIGFIIKKNKKMIEAIFELALVYIIVIGIIMRQIEPETFESVWQGIYWAGITMTTIGYGDIVPVTFYGQFVTIITSFAGIAIFGIPTAIFAATYIRDFDKISELSKQKYYDDSDHEI